ncbi:hypothetical protein SAMD00019534_067380 [Acytostelium subglobosum LB1]|uniref:hypothetical protein n=1 Tax=Acytostelium subglobosum LB1 TaxID=1410327 RepID=UPI0006449A16|nr:hypothetical protein SAMD00019534_067380 [Acytostelium subglobosum LB1]GAM23563.1 hypothetical protein SAMD00019534_067380 [Acytostelium subglobosum LB1]|eukprot:XP_012753304.1 hypothetical protein SAMD00019534_067380 [Acytostelium subglobosum LB1]
MTSKHSLRNPKDMQYAFSYFYYLIHKKVPFDLDKLWAKEIDINRDGYLNENELRTLAINVFSTPLKPTTFKEFKSDLYKTCMELRHPTPAPVIVEESSSSDSSDSSSSSSESSEDSGSTAAVPVIPATQTATATAVATATATVTATTAPKATTPAVDNNTLEVGQKELEACRIDLEVLKASNKTLMEIHKSYAKRTMYRTSIEGTDEVAFLMVDDNDNSTQTKLDGVRQRRHKFICLNDNINHDKPTAHLVIKVIHDFYESLFPFPSSFELPPGQTNHFRYIHEIIDKKQEENNKNNTFIYIFGVVGVMIVMLMWKRSKRSSNGNHHSINGIIGGVGNKSAAKQRSNKRYMIV